MTTTAILAGWREIDPVTWGWIMLAGVLWLAWIVVRCLIWPYAPCPRCEGRPRAFAGDGRHWRLCRQCGGSGSQLRWGARMLRGLGGRR